MRYATRPMRRGVPVPVLLLAVAAAGAGGYMLRTSGPEAPGASLLPKPMRAAVERAAPPTDVPGWIAARKAIIAAMRVERDALSRKYAENHKSDTDLNSAHDALNDAERSVDMVDKQAMRQDHYLTHFYMNDVDASLTEARGFIERAKK